MATVTLNEFVSVTLKDFGIGPSIRRDFHFFILRKHELLTDVWPLAFTEQQGGLFTWCHIFHLWRTEQFQS